MGHKKTAPQISLPGQEYSCGATLLDANKRPLFAYFHTPAFFTEGFRRTYFAFAFPFALRGPFEKS